VSPLWTNRSKPSIADDYATSDDFRRLFTEGLAGLHLLSYLLTGNREKAEQCFVGGLEDCLKTKSVFKAGAFLDSARDSPKCNSHDVAPSQPRRSDHSLSEPR
jgi:hypothetical protein